MSGYYEFRHIVSFAETNLVGNVYFTNHLKWQGRCREMFLHDHAPDVIGALQNDLALVTVRVSCDYLAELVVFDALIIRMYQEVLTQNRVTMRFEYWRETEDGEELIARGKQQVACMRRVNNDLVAAPFPELVRTALAFISNEALVA